ncbi:MAG: addiction module protein [Rhodanobacteraceae bacterium]|nr:addiction module protein [Pseudomonadota bacterium]
MSETTQALSAAASKLSPSDRVELVDQILASLGTPVPVLDAFWATEAEDRLAAWRRGEIKAIPSAEVLAKYPRT